MHSDFQTGVLKVTRQGYGFVEIDGVEYYVGANDMNGAMHRDTVSLSALPVPGPRRRARVSRIHARAHDTIVGRFERLNALSIVIPLDSRIGYDGIVIDGQAMDAKPGNIVVATIVAYPTRSQALQVAVSQIIAADDSESNTIDIIVGEQGIRTDFPSDALACAGEMTAPTEIEADRKDLRSLHTFTIDPVDARDFDDAISIESAGTNIKLYVHIADVSHYVTWDNPIDVEARQRGTSVYLPTKVIPMLPEQISNVVCSLNPHQDRLAFTVEMTVDMQGAVTSASFYRSMIHSDERYHYDEVLGMLDGAIPFRGSEQQERLERLKRCAILLEQQRLDRGSLEFDSAEAKVVLDENENPVDIKVRVKTMATQMIEEAMIAANEAVARFVWLQKTPMVYRVHDRPDADALDVLESFLHEFGYRLTSDQQMGPKIFQRILKASHLTPERYLVSAVMLKAMKRAYYSPERSEHFGLASEYYTHFTSPIRRYPDLMAHRILGAIVDKRGGEAQVDFAAVDARATSAAKSKGQGGAKLPDVMQSFIESLPALCEGCSVNERIAEQAERDATQFMLCRYMQAHIGERYSGIISNVSHFGFFVALDNTVEGLVHTSTLGRGPWSYTASKHWLTNSDDGRKYRLGQKVVVRVKAVSVEQRYIDFELIES